MGGRTDKISTRIRKEKVGNNPSRHYLMMKSGKLKSHYEWTKEISTNEYCELVKFQGNSISISKTRYIIKSSTNPNINVELDIYHDNLEGLMIAEVEDVSGNTSIIDNYQPESWFASEVTNDPDFYNVNLSYKNKKPHRNFIKNLIRK